MWRHNSQFRRGARRFAVALLVTLICLPALGPASSAQPLNGAGVVVRHGDGTLIYAYVQFEEESIPGDELLARTGLDLTFAPFGGLGSGVCMIDGEGCPADNCYCESYSSPAEYWHYYAYEGGTWVEQNIGPSSREIRDGDVDGWSWTAGEHGLPATSIDEIAAMNGVDRSPPEPTAPPTPTPAPPTPTFTPVPPTATFTPTPVPTNTPPPTSTPTPEPSATPAPSATATPQPPTATPTEPSPTPTATPSPSPEPTSTPAATATNTSTPEPSAMPSPEPTPSPSPTKTTAATSVAVIVTPGGTPQPLQPSPESDGSSNDYVVFGAVLALAIAGGSVLVIRSQRREIR